MTRDTILARRVSLAHAATTLIDDEALRYRQMVGPDARTLARLARLTRCVGEVAWSMEEAPAGLEADLLLVAAAALEWLESLEAARAAA